MPHAFGASRVDLSILGALQHIVNTWVNSSYIFSQQNFDPNLIFVSCSEELNPQIYLLQLLPHMLRHRLHS